MAVLVVVMVVVAVIVVRVLVVVVSVVEVVMPVSLLQFACSYDTYGPWSKKRTCQRSQGLGARNVWLNLWQKVASWKGSQAELLLKPA